MIMTNVDKLVVAFDERRHSLMKDGYNIITSTYTNRCMYNKFRQSSGKDVSSSAYINDCSIVQRTNGKVVHNEKVC